MAQHPHILTSLTPREAIADALYRGLIGFDSNELSIFNSAFAGEDVVFEVHSGDGKKVVNGLGSIRAEFLDHVGPMDTLHMVSNVRVDVKDGADDASLTAYVSAQHCPPGKGRSPDGPKYLTGGEYWVDLVRDKESGLWKIKKWVVKTVWCRGSVSVMQRPS